MSELPKGWINSCLKESLTTESFISDGDWVESKDQDMNGSVRLLQLADIGDGVFKNKSSRFMNIDTAKKLNCTFLEQGDLLIARMPDPLGRACIFPGVNQKAVTVVDVCLIRNRGDSAFINSLLKYWINSPLIRNLIDSNSSGSTRKRITRKKLEAFSLPLPPLAEQKRIVEKLDQVLAQVDTIKARLDGIPAILKRFRQSVLAAAVSGKLTEEWRGEHKIIDLIASISEFRGCILKELPYGWSWRLFGDVVTIASNLVDPLKTPDDIHIAPNHIEPRTGRLLDYKTVNEDLVKSAKHRFYSGQILYSKIRPYLCKAAIVNFDGLCSADMYPLNTKLEPKYLLNWLLSDQFTNWASNGDSRTVLPKINKKQLSAIPVPVPPIEEQTEIVRLVDQYFAFADAIEQQVKKAQQRVDKLTQSILAKAFKGELVPQEHTLDKNYEPADQLLKRIAAARAESDALAKAAKQAVKKTTKKAVKKS